MNPNNIIGNMQKENNIHPNLYFISIIFVRMGISRGIRDNIEQSKLETAVAMLADGLEPERVARLTKLPFSIFTFR
jgi:hypothetical protein